MDFKAPAKAVGAAPPVLRSKASDYLDLINAWDALRTRCEDFIREHKVMDPIDGWSNRDDIVLKWAENSKPWNEDNGLTMAELCFVTYCYYHEATTPRNNDLHSRLCYSSAIRLYVRLVECGFKPTAIDELFEEVSHMIVHVLSFGLDESANLAAQEMVATRSERDFKSVKAYNDWVAECSSKAGFHILSFIPRASRFFWHYWAELLIVRGAEALPIPMEVSDKDEKRPEEKKKDKFFDWINTQFTVKVNQSYIIALNELVYRNAIPIGGHDFHQRAGGIAMMDTLPSSTIAQMELPDPVKIQLADDLAPLPRAINENKASLAYEIGKVHMFAYTFDNRIRTSVRAMPFDPYIVWKSQIPGKLKAILKETRIWGRPQRPIIIQTQLSWYIRFLICTCPGVPNVGKHINSATSCVLKQKIINLGPGVDGAIEAMRKWGQIMAKDFDNKLACGTSIEKFSKESCCLVPV